MSGLDEHLASGVTTVCRAWIVERTDGLRLGFTDHDCPVVIDDLTCFPESGFSAAALQRSTGLAVDNAEAVGALTHDAITEADLRAGRWDRAEVTLWLVNWANHDERKIQFRGHLGEIGWADGEFTAELRGLSERLNHVKGRVYQPRCDAVLGDARCGVDLGASIFATEATVLEVKDDRVFWIEDLPDFSAKWFERGRLSMLDGVAEGLSERIKLDRTEDGRRRIELWGSLRSPVAPGDRFRMVAGCDKRSETCRFKFNNFLNFRGFPHIPGEDWLMSYPTSAGLNDGGRLR